MRRACLLLIPCGVLTCLSFSSGAALDAFQWQNPTPRGNTISSLVISGSSTARGADEITITENFGVAATFLVGGGLTVDAFQELETGTKGATATFIVGDVLKQTVILKSSAGSQVFLGQSGTFTPIAFPGGVDKIESAAVDPNDSNRIFMGTSEGTIWRSTDCGGTWSEVGTAEAPEIIRSIRFASPDDPAKSAAITSSGSFVTSTDGGLSWPLAYGAPFSPAAGFDTHYSQAPAPGRAGASLTVIAGAGGSIVRSTDGGANWIEAAVPPFDDFHGVSVLDTDRALVCGANGSVLITANAGVNWFAANTGTAVDLLDIWYVDASTAYCVGEYGTVLESTDGGVTWSDLTTGPRDAMYDVEYLSAVGGVAVGENGRLGRTTNGGITWQFEVTSPGDDLVAIDFNDASNGWIGGWRNNSSALVMRTTDGGGTWTDQTIGVGTVETIQFPDPLNGWAAGTGGLFRSTDAGVSWSPTPIIDSIKGMFFFDGTTGLVGGSNTLIRTTDAGATWSAVSAPSVSFVRSIDFPTASTGFAADDFGRIIRTTDGGLLWDHTVDLPGSDWLETVDFPSATTGFVVGFRDALRSSLHRTTDGGDTWEDISAASEVGHRLRGLFFRDEDHGTIVGDGGAILATDSGGTTAIRLSGLTATVEPGSAAVRLRWSTALEVEHDGFQVYRADHPGGPWEPRAVGLIRGRSPYTWVDGSVRPGREYWYLIGAVDTQGREERYGPVSAHLPERALVSSLTSIRPNPSRGRTEIRFVLASRRTVEVSVHDASGRLVQRVATGVYEGGEHALAWDGRDAKGHLVAAGVYFVRLRGGDGLTAAERVVRIR